MTDFNKEAHWQDIYSKKQLTEVSWYQKVPKTSLDFIERAVLSKNDAIIDVGGGDSFLVDHLLEEDYTDVTVLDISSKALDRAKKRLGEKAAKVNFAVSDASLFKSDKTFAFWHDRAAFHFLTEQEDIDNYKKVVADHIQSDGILVVGTFSDKGPTKCSGIPIKQYTTQQLAEVFQDHFELVNTLIEDHVTPFETVQNFSFVCMRRK
ncbi:class I SAM-dependent methyltransferase [Flammeovirga sp. SubArs3]|uniref:class I SAM-dependent methyltransferase n=1 Tax=Flammeovirga sp. SubArs3 TaxID=2995316 RepID=UPI00248B0592|nr:class I SAM-dependent methyltransferase [Flammeovirga sp. SubArs3]